VVCGLGSLSATTQDPLDQEFPTAKTVTFDVLVEEDLAVDTVLVNHASVTSNSFEDDNSDNFASTFSIVNSLTDSCTALDMSEVIQKLTSTNSRLKAVIFKASRQYAAASGAFRKARAIRTTARQRAIAIADEIANIPVAAAVTIPVFRQVTRRLSKNLTMITALKSEFWNEPSRDLPGLPAIKAPASLC
jgi:hypothetical protein